MRASSPAASRAPSCARMAGCIRNHAASSPPRSSTGVNSSGSDRIEAAWTCQTRPRRSPRGNRQEWRKPSSAARSGGGSSSRMICSIYSRVRESMPAAPKPEPPHRRSPTAQAPASRGRSRRCGLPPSGRRLWLTSLRISARVKASRSTPISVTRPRTRSRASFRPRRSPAGASDPQVLRRTWPAAGPAHPVSWGRISASNSSMNSVVRPGADRDRLQHRAQARVWPGRQGQAPPPTSAQEQGLVGVGRCQRKPTCNARHAPR